MNFLLLKYIHILSIAASFALLFIRGVWLLQSYPPAQERWVRILPHIVDSVLLLSALGMLHVHAAAGSGDWMSVKLGLIAIYAAALVYLAKLARNLLQKSAAWFLASLTFLFIASVSVLHDPRGILRSGPKSLDSFSGFLSGGSAG
jgi:uncharacterized membrane protein SirB2